MGRTSKPINWDIVEKQMEAKCDAKEIAGYFRIDVSNFYDRVVKEYGKDFATLATEMHSAGKGNIRARQYAKAMEGSNQMLIWLGKQWLDQKEYLDDKSLPPNDAYIMAALEWMKAQKENANGVEPKTDPEL